VAYPIHCRGLRYTACHLALAVSWTGAAQASDSGPQEVQAQSAPSPLADPPAVTTGDHVEGEQQPAASPQPRSTDADVLFRELFGKDRPPAVADNYVVLIDGVNVGEFAVDPVDSEAGTVEVRLVRAVLLSVAEAAMAERLRPLLGQDKVAFEELRATGLAVEFDSYRLALRIGFPIDLRQAGELRLRSARRREDIEFAEQADVSAYASFRAGIDLVEQSTTDGTGFSGLASVFDLGANVGGIAAQARFRYDERRTHGWSRGDVRLTYDDVDRLIRYEVGDLSVGRRPYQIAPRIAGISAFREFPIDPYRNVRPKSEQGFALEQPARIEVLLNGAPVRTYDLPAGRFNLQDFPLVPSAANDVELRITYATGEVEVIVFPAFYDIELLEPGLLDFAINLGAPFTDDDRGRIYDTGDYNVTGYVRYGVSPVLTAGVNWEGNTGFNLIGSELVWASPIGSIAFNAGMNVNDPGWRSGRAAVRYSWRDTDPVRGRAIDAQLFLTGVDYRTLNQVFGGNLTRVSATARAGQMFGPRIRGQVFAEYEDVREFGQNYYIGAGLSRQFRWGSVSLSADYRRNPEDTGPSVQISTTIPLGRGTVSSSYSSERNAARVEYNRLAALGVGSLGYSAGIERRDDFDRQFGRMTYIGNRFEASIDQTRQAGRGGQSDIRTGLSFGSALAMADGAFGISRPITNSFAIFEVDAGAADYQIAVEPRTGFGSSDTRYTAFSGAMGPAVAPNLPAYFERTIEVAAPGAPVGTSLGGQVFSLKPGFMSGYRLKVGSAQNVSILATLLDSAGNPIALAAGEARRVGAEADGTPMPVFTNGAGRFFLEGVAAGATYEVSISLNGTDLGATIAVPEDVVGVYRPATPISMQPGT